MFGVQSIARRGVGEYAGSMRVSLVWEVCILIQQLWCGCDMVVAAQDAEVRAGRDDL